MNAVIASTMLASHTNGWDHGWWPLWPLLWLAVIATVVWLTRHRWSGKHHLSGTDRAKEILAERYASGEITSDEYRERLDNSAERWHDDIESIQGEPLRTETQTHRTRSACCTARCGVVRLLLLFEASTFLVAAAIHFDALLEGYGHREAGTAETVIAVFLLAGLALTWRASPWPRRAATGAQAFAILGVLVGLFTIAVGVGPRTVLDVAYHLGILAVLVVGLAIVVRDRTLSLGGRHG